MTGKVSSWRRSIWSISDLDRLLLPCSIWSVAGNNFVKFHLKGLESNSEQLRPIQSISEVNLLRCRLNFDWPIGPFEVMGRSAEFCSSHWSGRPDDTIEHCMSDRRCSKPYENVDITVGTMDGWYGRHSETVGYFLSISSFCRPDETNRSRPGRSTPKIDIRSVNSVYTHQLVSASPATVYSIDWCGPLDVRFFCLLSNLHFLIPVDRWVCVILCTCTIGWFCPLDVIVFCPINSFDRSEESLDQAW